MEWAATACSAATQTVPSTDIRRYPPLVMQGESPEAAEEALLVDRARAGDGDALRALLRREGPRLRSRILRRIPSSMRSKISLEDVLQEAHAAAWQALPEFEFRGAGSFGAWIGQIVDARLTDQLRRYGAARRAVSRESPNAASSEGQLPGGGPTPSEIAIAAELGGRLRRAVAQLKPRQRQAIRLRLVDQCSFAEIGVALSCSENAAQKVVGRVLDHLWALCQELDRPGTPGPRDQGLDGRP